MRGEFPSLARYERPAPPAAPALSPPSREGKERERARRQRREWDAAASYSRSLLGAYRSLFRDLAPNLAFEDASRRFETVGRQADVRRQLSVMREEATRGRLTDSYGAERAGRMMTELERGLSGADRDGALQAEPERAHGRWFMVRGLRISYVLRWPCM